MTTPEEDTMPPKCLHHFPDPFPSPYGEDTAVVTSTHKTHRMDQAVHYESEQVPGGFDIIFVKFSDIYSWYADTNRSRDGLRREETLLGQVIELYERVYAEWPWFEKPLSRGNMLAKMNHGMSDQIENIIRSDSFFALAKKGDKVIGVASGVNVQPGTDVSRWLNPSYPRDNNQFNENLKKARKRAGMDISRPVTIITDMFIDPQCRGGEVAVALFNQLTERELANGGHEVLARTVSKREGVAGKEPRMSQLMTTLLGFRPIMDLGEPETNSDMRYQIYVGTAEEAHSGLLALREQSSLGLLRKKLRREIH